MSGRQSSEPAGTWRVPDPVPGGRSQTRPSAQCWGPDSGALGVWEKPEPLPRKTAVLTVTGEAPANTGRTSPWTSLGMLEAPEKRLPKFHSPPAGRRTKNICRSEMSMLFISGVK